MGKFPTSPPAPCGPRRRGDDDLRLAQLCCGDDPRPRRPFSKWKNAARTGRAALYDYVRRCRSSRPCERGMDGVRLPVESLLRARPGFTCEVSRACDVPRHGARGVCPILDRLDVCRHGGLARSDHRGDSTRRQAAPAPAPREGTPGRARRLPPAPSRDCHVPLTRIRLDLDRPVTDPTPPSFRHRREDVQPPPRHGHLDPHSPVAPLVHDVTRPRLKLAVRTDRVVQVHTSQPVTQHDPETGPHSGRLRLLKRRPGTRINNRRRPPKQRHRHLVGVMTDPARPARHLGRDRSSAPPVRPLPTRIRAEPGITPSGERDAVTAHRTRHADSLRRVTAKHHVTCTYIYMTQRATLSRKVRPRKTA